MSGDLRQMIADMEVLSGEPEVKVTFSALAAREVRRTIEEQLIRLAMSKAEDAKLRALALQEGAEALKR